MPLSVTAYPYTGPYYGPANPRGPNKGPTAKALKRALIRLKYLDAEFTDIDEHYNYALQVAMRKWQRSLKSDVQPSGQYGRGSWEAMRGAKVLDGPHKGEWAMDGVGQKLIQKEWLENQAPTLDDARKAIAEFCLRAEAHESVWHYSQRRPFDGFGVAPELAHINDCSGYAVLAYDWARRETGLAVPDPSGHTYSGYGNTWDDLDGHPKVSGSYLIGDLAHYDGHVMICRKAGDGQNSLWSSHGSEGGPDARQLFYRDDFLFVVRPPLE